ncbi:MAG: hypothetical protein AseanaTS_00350 [Candidatus Pelagadaptatus aseana]|uniref:BLUF domain-containing protein n=1 Tax=Candidatus Pelagadaptatus aseana TaxID=3120508 RepID=UPI0039B1D10F
MYRLIYKSTGIDVINWDTVESIMHASEDYNRRKDITGVLLASNSSFLQVLEGRYEDINEAFMRIVMDDRHTDVKLIVFHPIDSRLFSSWHMKGIGVFDLSEDTAKALKQKYGESNGEVNFPLEEWQVLAMVQDINLVLDIPEWKK